MKAIESSLSLLAFAIFSVVVSTTTAQADECQSHIVHHYKMETDPAYAQAYAARQQLINENIMLRGGGAEEVYTIPIVVHVIHEGEPVGTGSNISDEQILESIDGLNNRFQNLNTFGVDVNIEFCLAKRAPDGCPTTGIVRVDGTVLPGYLTNGIVVPAPGFENCGGASDVDVKDLSKWPVSDYYNIWVVNGICGGYIAGYAYYPWGEPYDGTVIRYDYMMGVYTVLTHELGHGFDVAHTFEGDGGNQYCPSNLDCMMEGDLVCDTPPHKQNDCGETNPCTAEGIWDNCLKNFMSYCSGTNRFTQGQKDRMRATMLVYPRADLLNSMGCVPSELSLPADLNYDGAVNVSDLLLFTGEFGCLSGCGPADLNQDGSVNVSDLLIFTSSFGAMGCQ